MGIDQATVTANQSKTGSCVWGIKTAVFLLMALCIQAVVMAVGWSIVGEHFDSPGAFIIWLGVAPGVVLLAGVFWDNYARKTLSLLGVVLFCVLGFIGGMAYFEPELFKNAVFHGAYLDDFGIYAALAIGANLAGGLAGIFIHFLMGRSLHLRAQTRGMFDQGKYGADENGYDKNSWNRPQ